MIYARKIPGICLGLFLEEYFSEVFPLQYLLHKKIPEKVKDKVFYKEGKTHILDFEKTKDFIIETAKYDLEDIKKAVLKNDENWLKIKKLKHI